MKCQLRGKNEIYIQILHHDMPCIKDLMRVYIEFEFEFEYCKLCTRIIMYMKLELPVKTWKSH